MAKTGSQTMKGNPDQCPRPRLEMLDLQGAQSTASHFTILWLRKPKYKNEALLCPPLIYWGLPHSHIPKIQNKQYSQEDAPSGRKASRAAGHHYNQEKRKANGHGCQVGDSQPTNLFLKNWTKDSTGRRFTTRKKEIGSAADALSAIPNSAALTGASGKAQDRNRTPDHRLICYPL
ncbi:hypothetical protein PoB_005696500 [Plakobranchus ocellatus]|uniref:Uncharacterized protein n=1 Tax=Plakobranchus ocellatus TaxID=259542 RepID=A0AAV4CCJ1_9GAST|nr:hypothetical protein PoB_005696500 [Plakobranchus ocellatus]